MLMPVRCFTCGKVLSDTFERFVLLEKKLRKEAGKDEKMDGEAMDQLHITRYCCRRMLMTHVDLLEKFLRCSLKDHKERLDSGWAWWVNYEEEKQKEADLQWLLSEKRKRGSLGEGKGVGSGGWKECDS